MSLIRMLECRMLRINVSGPFSSTISLQVYQLQDYGRNYGPQAREIARKCHPYVKKP